MPAQGLGALGQFLKRIMGQGGIKASGSATGSQDVTATPGSNQTNITNPNQPQNASMVPPVAQGTTGKGSMGKVQSTPQVPTDPVSTHTQTQRDEIAAAQNPGMTDTGQATQKPADYSSIVDFSKGFKTKDFSANLVGMSGEGQNFKKETERLLAAGDLAGLEKHFATVSSNKAYSPYTSAIMDKVKASMGPNAAGGQGGQPGQPGQAGSGNVFAEGTVQERFNPQIEGIYNQRITEADQQLESEQAIRDETGALYGQLEDTRDRAGQTIEGLQDEAGQMHDQFTQERQALSQQVMNMPEQVTQKFDQAVTDVMGRVDSAQALIDSKESAAMSQVMQGKSAAMQSAVQGIQGNINAQISQIQGNPNMTAAQKQTAISQVKMQGMSQIAPAVGSTILQFNDLAARTAVSFGQMTTQIQGQGIASMTQLAGAGAEAYANTTVAANQIGASLINMQASADSNYISNVSNLESTRATIEMAGDTLRAQLLPGMGKPYAQYADAMVEYTQNDFDLQNTEFQNILGKYGMDVMAFIHMQNSRNADSAMWGDLFQEMPGPLGQILGFGSMALNQFTGSNQQAPTAPGPQFGA